MPNTCATCVYHISGNCQRSAPGISDVANGTFSGWPPVDPVDWCGQWSASGAIAVCSSCIYWRDGLCRRDIPQVGSSPQATFSDWPKTHASDKCGDWSATIPIPPTPQTGPGYSWYSPLTTNPTAALGVDGDWASVNNGTIWAKVNGTWLQVK